MGSSAVDTVTRITGRIPCRLVLSIISFVGCMNLYMVRVNLSVIIVAMVRPSNNSLLTTDQNAECSSQDARSQGNHTGQQTITINSSEILLNNSIYLSSSTTTIPEEAKNRDERYDWDELTQGFILASFFYGYTMTQIIGGRLAEKYGMKLVFGICILSGGLTTVLTPLASGMHFGVLIALRVLQGALQGVAWPALHVLVVRWIPPLERGKFIAFVYNANVIGTTLTLPLCGIVIEAYGWPAAFYITGSCSLVWCFWWFLGVYDFPEDHPRISQEEKTFIHTAIRASGTSFEPPKSVPWKKVATSLPVWSNILCDIGNSFGFALCITHIPTYMKNILGFSISENGLLSATPFLSRYCGGLLYSSIGDWLLSRNMISVTNNRKLFSAIAMFGPALVVIGVAYSGCDPTAAVILLCLTLFFNGAVATSLFINHCDIAPNFSGTLMGLTNTGASVTSFIAPVVAGALTNNQQTASQWRKLFWLCVPIYSLPEIFFLIFASGEVQEWNYTKPKAQMDIIDENAIIHSKDDTRISDPLSNNKLGEATETEPESSEDTPL